MSNETIIISGDLVGRDNLATNTPSKPGGVSVDDILAAKLKAKLAESEREAEEEAQENQAGNSRQGGVTIKGGVIKVGGRIVSGDLIIKS